MPVDYLNLLAAIQQQSWGLTAHQEQMSARFGVILDRENKSQNLTRILGVEDFVHGHLKDVVELFHVEQLGQKVLDIGSGSGVPGLLAATIDLSTERAWILTESEKSKAEYLQNAADELALKNVSVFAKRAEEVIESIKPDTVVARAVGRVEKIASWVSACSTWNNLILFKSRGWEEEWKEAQQNRFGKKLTINHQHEYSSQVKCRLLVSLSRK